MGRIGVYRDSWGILGLEGVMGVILDFIGFHRVTGLLISSFNPVLRLSVLRHRLTSKIFDINFVHF